MQEACQALPGEALGCLLLAVAAGEDDLDAGVHAPQLPERLGAVHVRHGHIQQDDGNAGIRGVLFQALAAVFSEQRDETRAFEDALCNLSHGRIVIDDQHFPARTRRRPAARSRPQAVAWRRRAMETGF